MWRLLGVISQRLERLELKVEKIDEAQAQLDARIERSDLRVDRFADQMSDAFVRVTHRIDELRKDMVSSIKELEGHCDHRFERIEARLDAIDGRLVTLTATVTLHELKLREAT